MLLASLEQLAEDHDIAPLSAPNIALRGTVGVALAARGDLTGVPAAAQIVERRIPRPSAGRVAGDRHVRQHAHHADEILGRAQ